jgi:hypothetical protein
VDAEGRGKEWQLDEKKYRNMRRNSSLDFEITSKNGVL